MTWSRRGFLHLSAAGAGAFAVPQTLEALARATSAVAAQAADDVARNEAYWRDVRRAFTLDPARLNLNNANSSPCPDVVHRALVRDLDVSNLLPVVHRGRLEQRFEEVRRALALEFGCEPDEMAVTRNATEALHIVQAGLDLAPGDEVLTTDQDYARMLWMWDQRGRRDGIAVRRIQFPVPTTAEDLLNRFEAAITTRTRVLQFCHVTNATGQLFPVRELCRLARERGIVTIVDGAQAAGHFPFSLRVLECDFYGTSLHKWLMAPHGTGFLYVRRGSLDRVWPLQGAPANERTIHKLEEIGTQAAAPRVGIADAIAFQRTIGLERKAARLHYLTRRWIAAVADLPRTRLLSRAEPDQVWGLATLGLVGVPAAPLVQRLLDEHRIVVSPVVSQGRPGPVFDFQGIRVSPGIYSTPAEIDTFVTALRRLL